MKLTAIVKKGEKQYVALCPEVDVVSQGHTVEESLNNLREAVELHIEVEGFPEEFNGESAIITSFEVTNGGETSKIVG